MRHLTPVPNDPHQLRAFLDQLGQARVETVFEAMRRPEVVLADPPAEVRALTIKVTLKGTKPAVWRRLVVSGDTTLDHLHDVLQTTMGWAGGHLHAFRSGPSHTDPAFVTQEDLDEGEEGTLEDQVRVDQLLRDVGDRIGYEYDFGDGWHHELRLERADPPSEDQRPRCLAGRLACPPEDCGGIGGYADLAGWVRAGRPADDVPTPFQSAAEADEWLPLHWHPDEFDADEVDLMLQAESLSGDLLDGLRPGLVESLEAMSPAGLQEASAHLAAARGLTLTVDDVVELTGPHRTLLAAIEHPVSLSAAGYLPPDLVEGLCQALDVDPLLAGRANRESNVKMLLLFRKAMQEVGLLHTQYKLLMQTVRGIEYADSPLELWAHLALRLPLGRSDLKRDAGWYTLLALAGGAGRVGVFDAVHRLCLEAGWVDDHDRPVHIGAIPALVWPTMSALLGPGWNSRKPWPAWVPAAAADVLTAGVAMSDVVAGD